jgi:OHCU decarboxylase
MASRRPFRDPAHLCEVADQAWWSLDRADWLEAVRAHPKIGERAAKDEAIARRWAEQEQAAARLASENVAARLAAQNLAYEKKFGYTFLVDATGKSSEEMLAILGRRIQNEPEAEVREAAEQQRRITRRRSEKLLSEMQ